MSAVHSWCHKGQGPACESFGDTSGRAAVFSRIYGRTRVFTVKRSALTNLPGITAQGALVRSRHMELSQKDSPSQFFFGLEKKNGQHRSIQALPSYNGTLMRDSDIRYYASFFYQKQFSLQLSEKTDGRIQFSQVIDEKNCKLKAPLSISELTAGVGSLKTGKTRGIDGLPAEFYKAF